MQESFSNLTPESTDAEWREFGEMAIGLHAYCALEGLIKVVGKPFSAPFLRDLRKASIGPSEHRFNKRFPQGNPEFLDFMGYVSPITEKRDYTTLASLRENAFLITGLARDARIIPYLNDSLYEIAAKSGLAPTAAHRNRILKKHGHDPSISGLRQAIGHVNSGVVAEWDESDFLNNYLWLRKQNPDIKKTRQLLSKGAKYELGPTVRDVQETIGLARYYELVETKSSFQEFPDSFFFTQVYALLRDNPGRVPTTAAVCMRLNCDKSVIRNRFGSTNSMLNAAGIPRIERGGAERHAVFNALFGVQHRRLVTATDYRYDRNVLELPSLDKDTNRSNESVRAFSEQAMEKYKDEIEELIAGSIMEFTKTRRIPEFSERYDERYIVIELIRMALCRGEELKSDTIKENILRDRNIIAKLAQQGLTFRADANRRKERAFDDSRYKDWTDEDVVEHTRRIYLFKVGDNNERLARIQHSSDLLAHFGLGPSSAFVIGRLGLSRIHQLLEGGSL